MPVAEAITQGLKKSRSAFSKRSYHEGVNSEKLLLASPHLLLPSAFRRRSLNDHLNSGSNQFQPRVFIVDPQGVAREVLLPHAQNSAMTEFQRMQRRWEEETCPKIIKDSIGRLIAIAGLVIVFIAAYFDRSFWGYDLYVAGFGFVLLAVGRGIMLWAAYEPAQRMQDNLENGASVVEKIGHWFGG